MKVWKGDSYLIQCDSNAFVFQEEINIFNNFRLSYLNSGRIPRVSKYKAPHNKYTKYKFKLFMGKNLKLY